MARRRLYHLRKLNQFRISRELQKTFYSATIESVISGNITTWYGNSNSQDKKALHRVIRCAEKITSTALPGLQVINTRCCLSRANTILKDCHHPGHKMFQCLPPGKRFRSQKARTERLRFFFPQAIRTMNAKLPVFINFLFYFI